MDPTPSTGRGPLGVAVIGCGYWGPNLVRNFSENARSLVLGVADTRQARLDAIERKVPGARLTTRYEDLLADPDIEAVAIATPVSTHYGLARAALEAGKHVMVTKPLAASVVECDALIDLAADVERVLAVDHTFVFTSTVRKMRELIDERALGDIYYFDSVRVNLGLFQHDVNVIWDLAAHDFAIIDHLLDARPTAVSATGVSHSASGQEDVAYVTVLYDGDLIAHCHLNWLSPVKIRQTLIGGSERMLVWDDLVPDEKLRVYDRGISEVADAEGYYETIVDYRIGDVWMPRVERTEALATEVDHFIDCVRKGARPIAGGAEGREVVRLLEATSASLAAGGQAILVNQVVET